MRKISFCIKFGSVWQTNKIINANVYVLGIMAFCKSVPSYSHMLCNNHILQHVGNGVINLTFAFLVDIIVIGRLMLQTMEFS